MRVTVDLAKKHLEYSDYSIEVYKADVVKLIHYIEELEQKLTLTDVSSMFSAKQMEQAFNDGVEAEQQRCGEFEIENYAQLESA